MTLRLIERGAFLETVEREPALALGLLRSLAGMVRATNERLSDLLTLDVSGRLAKWLLAHAAAQPPAPGAAVPFAISQSDLAAEVGATRVRVNRALNVFESIGAIAVERERIVLLRPDLLKRHTVT
ncbi:MAG: Crp/Fnr family transcriptional regulator [Thermomicrobiales bacterium]